MIKKWRHANVNLSTNVVTVVLTANHNHVLRTVKTHIIHDNVM